jgi:hypothetical protein
MSDSDPGVRSQERLHTESQHHGHIDGISIEGRARKNGAGGSYHQESDDNGVSIRNID